MLLRIVVFALQLLPPSVSSADLAGRAFIRLLSNDSTLLIQPPLGGMVSIVNFTELSSTKSELSTALVRLTNTEIDLSSTKSELNLTKSDLNLTKSDLSSTKSELSSALFRINGTDQLLFSVLNRVVALESSSTTTTAQDSSCEKIYINISFYVIYLYIFLIYI